MEIIPLCGFAFLAGLVDSVAGGGGLIQIPALLLLLPDVKNAPMAVVFGTNKLVSICGTTAAFIQYARQVPMAWGVVAPATGAAFVCSFLGAMAVSHLPNWFLRPLVLILLTAVWLYTLWRKDLGATHAPKWRGMAQIALAMATGGGIGFYDGFFGPGTGSFLIFAFVGIFGFDFLSASAGAKLINVGTNLAALMFFAVSGHIRYEVALPMALCNVSGSLVGTRLALKRGSKFVRIFFLWIVAAMIIRYGWEVLRK